MHTRRIGDVEVSAIGLGGMPMSIEGRPDEARSLATIHAALDAGLTLIDTADAYHLHADEVGHNEALIAKALASHDGGTDVLVATKGGHLRPGDGSWTLDGSPAHIKEACEASLRRLGVEAIGLYQFHRPDPKVPYAESVGAVRDLLDEGKIRMAGISNADPDADPAGQRDPRRPAGLRAEPVLARRSAPASRSCGCATSWASRSCPGVRSAASPGPAGSARAYAPFARIAEAHGVSPQRVCLAWMLAKSPVVVPIPGSSRPETIRDSAAAVDLVLSAEESAELDAA